MGHKQLTWEQRYHISGLWKAGYTQTKIAEEVGVHKSTISREFKRNTFWWNSRIPQYKPDYAQAYTKSRHRHKKKNIKFTNKIEAFVREKLLLDWSPDQISAWFKPGLHFCF